MKDDDRLSPRAPFEGLLQSSFGSKDGLQQLRYAPRHGLQLATVINRGSDRVGFGRKVEEVCGLSLPSGPRRTTFGRMAALGIGTRTWLFMEDEGAPGFARRLRTGLGSTAAVSDQSDAYAVIRIAGACARAVLGKGLPVDLHPRAFDTTHVAVTLCSHVGVTVWQPDDAPTFEIAFSRSYAASFMHWLKTSAAEFDRSEQMSG